MHQLGHSLLSFRLAVVGILLSGVGLQLQALDWPHWRGPDYTGISQEAGWSDQWPAEGPRVLWRTRVGIGFSSFAVADGRTYTMGNAGKAANEDTVFCFDSVTGREIWRHTYTEDLAAKFYEGGPSATPTVVDGRVYTLSKSARLLCLNAADGTVIWNKFLPNDIRARTGQTPEQPTWGFASSVLVHKDRLFVNVGTYGTALDKEGNIIWTTGSAAAGYSTPLPFVMRGQPGLALFAAQEAVAVDPDTGKLLWSHPWKTSYDVNAADPIISGDLVFISSGYNVGAATLSINRSQASELWRSRAMRNQFNSAVLIDGHIYGVDENQLRCLDLKTGDVKWTDRSVGKGSLMAADGRLIVLSEKGELMVAPATPTAFNPTARAQILGGRCWTTPILSHGRIVARNAAGDVVSVDVSR